MRWIFVRNAVNFEVNFVKNKVKYDELFFFQFIHRIAYINLSLLFT